MSRKVLIPLLAAAFLATPAFLPEALPGAASAHAVINLNSSRSNIYRVKTRKAVRATTVKGSKSNSSDRMGGGGGKGAAARATTVKSSKSNTSDRMGGGGGKRAAARATTVKSSKSNISDRMGGGGGRGVGGMGISFPGR